MCTGASFTARVLNTADLQITQSTFAGCQLKQRWLVGTCTATATGTFTTPWTATARTTSDVQIHNVDIDIPLDTKMAGSLCAGAGQSLRITGTLTGGKWLGNAAGQHGVEILGLSGLVSHSALTGTVADRSDWHYPQQ